MEQSVKNVNRGLKMVQEYPKIWYSTEAPYPFYYLVILLSENNVLKLKVTDEDITRLKEELKCVWDEIFGY